MTQAQKNFLTMTNGVLAHFDNYDSLWKEHLLVSQLVETNRKLKLQAEAEINRQSVNTVGHTSHKDLLFEDMVARSYKAALKLSAYARLNKNEVLLHKVDFAPTVLARGAESEVLSRCSVIAQEYALIVTELVPYKGSQAELDEVNKAIEAYKTAPAQRDTAGSERRTATAAIPNLITSIRENFLILDDLVEGTIDDEPFVETYFNLRELNSRKGSRKSKPEITTGL